MTKIILGCGFIANQYFNKQKEEFLDISLYGLYRGCGDYSDFNQLSALFKELAEKGYKSNGIMVETGYYDSIDDIVLSVVK